MVEEQHHPADSVAAERLWDAIFRARAGESAFSVADLEDAAFMLYLPMARSAAATVCGESARDTDRATQAAEVGLARAILAWRSRTPGGFRQFARSAIIRQLANP